MNRSSKRPSHHTIILVIMAVLWATTMGLVATKTIHPIFLLFAFLVQVFLVGLDGALTGRQRAKEAIALGRGIGIRGCPAPSKCFHNDLDCAPGSGHCRSHEAGCHVDCQP
jgi:hypothetical protein